MFLVFHFMLAGFPTIKLKIECIEMIKRSKCSILDLKLNRLSGKNIYLHHDINRLSKK